VWVTTRIIKPSVRDVWRRSKRKKDIRGSGYQEIRISGDQDIRRPGYQETRISGDKKSF